MDIDKAEWIAEALLRFLEGPEYRTPLLDFVDAQCLIFEDSDENKLEYTKIHREFKARVERLITNFLRDIGVSATEFQAIVADAITKKRGLSSFLVASVLAVDDFLQFKAMMLRHSASLTEEVLSQMPTHDAPGAAQNSSDGEFHHSELGDSTERGDGDGTGGDTSEDIKAAIKLSREQFEREKAALVQQLGISDASSYVTRNMTPDEELAMAVAESLRQEFHPHCRPISGISPLQSSSLSQQPGTGKTEETRDENGQASGSPSAAAEFVHDKAKENDGAPTHSAAATASKKTTETTSSAPSQDVGQEPNHSAPPQPKQPQPRAPSVSNEEIERRREHLKMQKAKLIEKKAKMRAENKAKAVQQKPEDIYHQAAPAKFDEEQSELEEARASMSVAIGEQMKLRMAEAARKAFKGLDIR